MKIESKGFNNLRPEDHEKKNFDPTSATFLESENKVQGFEGRQFTLSDVDGHHVGDLLLVNDAQDDSWIKIKIFGVDKEYRGSGAVDLLYGKSFQIAKEDDKDLVMDSAVGVAAYKSFLKYIENQNYNYEENPLIKLHEPTQTYQAADLTYTVRVKKENFK